LLEEIRADEVLLVDFINPMRIRIRHLAADIDVSCNDDSA